MKNEDLVGIVADLAKEVGTNDPIEFGSFDMDQDAMYNMMASNVIDKYNGVEENELILLSTITHLLIENFILNVKLSEKT